MLLAIDIGNTNIVAGVFDGDSLQAHWRIGSEKNKTSDEIGVLLLNLLGASGMDKKALTGAIACSVVPEMNGAISEAVKKYLGLKLLFVGEDARAPIKVDIDNPREAGADRIVNAVAAYSVHKTALIIVDFGTAVTFDYVSPEGVYSGGAIAPGINISAEALHLKTAKLPKVEARRPPSVIGRNTVDAIRSGLFWGFIGLVDGIIERMIREVETAPRVIATGGLARLVIGHSRYVTEPDEFLTLKGLKIIYEGKR